MIRKINRINTCLYCGKVTTTPSHTSRIKRYCDNSCQNLYEKSIGLRGDGTPKIISADELRKLYIDERKSCLQIGRMIGKSIKQVSRYLKSCGIELRPFSTKGLAPHIGNCQWKGGITPLQVKERSTLEYRLWRKAVFQRDNFTCRDCGKRGGDIHAHHVKAFSRHPELRTAIDNGLTLCVKCHKKTFNHYE